VNSLLYQNNIINHLSLFDETSLTWGDEGGEEGFYSVGKDFGENFVGNVAEGDGSKSVEG
jgi:hypothetical protein